MATTAARLPVSVDRARESVRVLSDRRVVDAMSLAIEHARAGLGSTGRNPCVGAVVLDARGAVVGIGRTEPHTPHAAGRHAEVVALAEAGERAVGGTVVSTLEPCNGTGRTGPCSEAIIRAGIRQLVFALSDPLPRFAGGGDWLAGQGVEVRRGVLADDALSVHGPWLTAVRRGTPFVTLKLASTLDGRASAADGTLAVDHVARGSRRRAFAAEPGGRDRRRVRHRARRRPAADSSGHAGTTYPASGGTGLARADPRRRPRLRRRGPDLRPP